MFFGYFDGYCFKSTEVSIPSTPHFSPWDRGQIGIKLGKKTCYIPKANNFSLEKGYLY